MKQMSAISRNPTCEVISDPATVARELAEALADLARDPETPRRVHLIATSRLEIIIDRCRAPKTIPIGLSLMRKLEAAAAFPLSAQTKAFRAFWRRAGALDVIDRLRAEFGVGVVALAVDSGALRLLQVANLDVDQLARVLKFFRGVCDVTAPTAAVILDAWRAERSEDGEPDLTVECIQELACGFPIFGALQPAAMRALLDQDPA